MSKKGGSKKSNKAGGNQPTHHLPKNAFGIKTRARRFTAALLAGKSQSEALREAGYAETVARSGNCALLRNPQHIKPFITTLHEKGITDDFLADKVRALLDAQATHFFSTSQDGQPVILERQAPALETQRKTLELAAKLKGHLKEQSQVDINVGIMAMVVSAIRETEAEEDEIEIEQ